MNNKPFTTTLDPRMHRFLKEEAARRKTSCRTIIEEALRQYRKVKLAKEIDEGFTKERKQEYREICREFLPAQRKIFSE